MHNHVDDACNRHSLLKRSGYVISTLYRNVCRGISVEHVINKRLVADWSRLIKTASLELLETTILHPTCVPIPGGFVFHECAAETIITTCAVSQLARRNHNLPSLLKVKQFPLTNWPYSLDNNIYFTSTIHYC